jgi:hypothetical protein
MHSSSRTHSVDTLHLVSYVSILIFIFLISFPLGIIDKLCSPDSPDS